MLNASEKSIDKLIYLLVVYELQKGENYTYMCNSFIVIIYLYKKIKSKQSPPMVLHELRSRKIKCHTNPLYLINTK